MKPVALLASLAAAAIVAVEGSSRPVPAFLSLVNRANPEVARHADAQESALLKISVDVAQNVESKSGGRNSVLSGQRLGIEGLTIELRGDKDEGARRKRPNLPGADGPNPQLSSGARALDVVRPGTFVDLTGTKVAGLENGAWEIVWRNNAKAGSLICGFDVPEAIKRNEAAIPKGRVYMTFPLWTDDTLQHLRRKKAEAEERAVEALDRVKDTSARLVQTTNPIEKVILFRDAMKAHEELEYTGINSYNRMALERDMVKLEGGLRLCSLGTVWTKKDGWFGGDHVMLGTVSARSGEREEERREAVTERELKSVAFDGLRPSAREWS